MKYLFKALYTDGSEYLQNEQDESIKINGKSSFTDVLEDVKNGKEIQTFELADKENNKYSVNLQDGSFNLRGVKVGSIQTGKEIFNRRIIYFRRNTLDFNPGDLKKKNHSIVFFLGWQGNTSDGGNISQTIEID